MSSEPESWGWQRIAAIVIAVLLGVLGVVQVADPTVSGVSVRAAFWLGVVATGLGILQSFLPPVQRG